MSGINVPNQANNKSQQPANFEVEQKITKINPRKPGKPGLLNKIVSKVSAFATALFGTVEGRKALSTEKKEIRAKNAQESKLDRANIASIKKELSGLKEQLNKIQYRIKTMQEDGKAFDPAMQQKEIDLEKAIKQMELKLKIKK